MEEKNGVKKGKESCGVKSKSVWCRKGGHSHTQTMIGCVAVQQPEGENESERCGFFVNYKAQLAKVHTINSILVFIRIYV